MDLVLMLEPGDGGAPAEVLRLARTPAAVREAATAARAHFRELSGARGMTMSDEEIRATCWAPMAAKLAAYARADDLTVEGAPARFAGIALAFLATAGFAPDEATTELVVTLRADGEIVVSRAPRPLLGAARRCLGNHREAMAAMAGPLTQLG